MIKLTFMYHEGGEPYISKIEESNPMSRVPEETLIGIIRDVEEHYDCTYVLGDDPQLAKEIAAELRSARKLIDLLHKRNIIAPYRDRDLDVAILTHLAQFPEEE